MTANDNVESLWKETVVAYLKVLSQRLCEESKENHECLGQDIGLRTQNWTQDVPNTKNES
jgi:hypothetical protein